MKELAILDARERESLLRTAITARLGTVWDYLDVSLRCKRVVTEGQPELGETWLLDDKPMITFFPPDVQTVQNGHSIKLVCTTRYREFPTPAPSSPPASP